MSEAAAQAAAPALPADASAAAQATSAALARAAASAPLAEGSSAGMLAAMGGAEKAMLLLVSLDEDVATRVIAHLGDREVAALRKATETMREVPNEVLVSVHREFLTRVQAGLPTSLDGSGAYLRRIVGNALGEGKAAELWRERKENDGVASFVLLETPMLAALLDAEHPQTVAVVLSQLDATKAADTLAKMRADRRAEILQRINRLESVPEQVIDDIEREFAGHVSRMGDERRRAIKGKDAAAGILKRLRQEDGAQIIDELSQVSPEMADSLRQALFTFEDLQRVDGRGMQQLLKEVPTDQLVLALKTASEELREKVFGNLSARAAEMLREDLGLLGPVKVSDVETAQRSIVDIALQLERDGRIAIAREGGGDYV